MKLSYLAGSCCAGRRITLRRRGVRFLLLRIWRWLAGAPDSGGSNIVGPNIDGKVLEGIAILGALLGILLGECQHGLVIVSMVVDRVFIDSWDVENAMQKINGPDCV